MEEYGINRITPSMLVEYDKCPKLFYYRSWLGLKLPQPFVHLKFGTAIHLGVDTLYDKEKTITDSRKIFLDNFTLDCIDDESLSPEEKKDKYEEMKEDGLTILDEYSQMKSYLSSEGVNPIQFEIPIKIQLENPVTKEKLPLPLSCRIDALGDDNRVIEYKTSSKPYDELETRASLQSLSYAWVRYTQTGVIPRVDYVVMLKKRKKDKIQYLSFIYDESDILSFDSKVRSILQRIKNREFDKPTKNHDFFCDCKKYEVALQINK